MIMHGRLLVGVFLCLLICLPARAEISFQDFTRFALGLQEDPFLIEAAPQSDLRDTLGINHIRDLPPLLLPGTTPTPPPPISPLPPHAMQNQTVYLVGQSCYSIVKLTGTPTRCDNTFFCNYNSCSCGFPILVDGSGAVYSISAMTCLCPCTWSAPFILSAFVLPSILVLNVIGYLCCTRKSCPLYEECLILRPIFCPCWPLPIIKVQTSSMFQGMDAFIGDDQEENIMQVRPTDSVQAQLQKVQDAIAAAKREAARKRAELMAADAMRREQEIDPAYQKSLEDMADGANGELELARLTLNNLHLRQMPQIKQDENNKMMLAPPTAITIKPSSQQGNRDPRLAGRRGSVTNVAGRRGSVSTAAAGRRGSVAKAGASEQKYRVKVPALGLTDASALLAPPAPGSLAEKVSVGASVFEYTLSERAFLSGFDEGAGRFGTELDEEAANALLSEQDDAFGTLDDLAYLQNDSLVGGLIEDINSHIFTSNVPEMMPGFVPSPTNLSKTTSPVNVVVKSQVSPTYSTASLNVPAYRAQAATSPSNAQGPSVISPTASKTVAGAFGGFSASAAIAAATEHVGIDTNLGGDAWLDTDLDAHTAAQLERERQLRQERDARQKARVVQLAQEEAERQRRRREEEEERQRLADELAAAQRAIQEAEEAAQRARDEEAARRKAERAKRR